MGLGSYNTQSSLEDCIMGKKINYNFICPLCNKKVEHCVLCRDKKCDSCLVAGYSKSKRGTVTFFHKRCFPSVD